MYDKCIRWRKGCLSLWGRVLAKLDSHMQRKKIDPVLYYTVKLTKNGLSLECKTWNYTIARKKNSP